MSTQASNALPPPQARGFKRLWRTLRQLFHEVIGALFGLFALLWAQNAFRAWTKDIPRWVSVLSLAFAVLMAVFAWTSFRRAKQVR